MIRISNSGLREGCERAHDLFLLNRLRGQDDAATSFDAVYEALGVTGEMREQLGRALLELVPVRGMAVLESAAVAAMMAGVLVGFLIADSELPCEELDLPVKSQ